MSRYEIIGPKYNPAGAYCYRVWDHENGDWMESLKWGWAQEFLKKEDAEAEVVRRGV